MPWNALKNLFTGTWNVNRIGIDLLEDFATGDIDRETLDKFFDLFGASFEILDDLEDVVKAQAFLAAVIAYSQVVGAISSGEIQIPMAVEAIKLYNRIEAETQPIIARFKAAEARARGIVDTQAVQEAISLARIAHTAGMIFSREYRGQIIQLQDSTQQIALRVFGNASMVNSALSLLQMAYFDGARLSGKSISDAEANFFAAQIKILNNVEANASRYARSPGLFWYDFQNLFLAHQINANNIDQQRRDSRLNGIVWRVDQTTDVAKDVSDRFRDYRRELDPFIDKETARELDKMRREYETDVLTPLAAINRTVQEEFPAAQLAILEQQREQEAMQKELDTVTEFTAPPDELDEAATERRSAKWQSIIDSTLGFDGITPESLLNAHDRLEEIYGELP